MLMKEDMFRVGGQKEAARFCPLGNPDDTAPAGQAAEFAVTASCHI